MGRKLVTGLTAGLIAVAVPGTALPQDNPQGCKANGQAVATSAQAQRPFGHLVVRENVPIADDVATFKALFCGAE